MNCPLPLPLWSSISKPCLTFEEIWQYEDFVGMVELTLQRLLKESHYDTVHNFLEFYKAYKSSSISDLVQFFQHYTPPINRQHHMCVSLAMEMVERLSATNLMPKLDDHCFLVSCEQSIETSAAYIDQFDQTPTVFRLEKEHALLAIKVAVAGREGVLLLDPGYHVARAVTVMKDQLYPHTGWFTQSDESTCKLEYCYTFNPSDPKFVVWAERQTREKKLQHEVSLVYVDKPYRTAVDVTVRRNLVYNFRSLVSRSAKGRVCAGIYFLVVNSGNEAQMTMFYDDNLGGGTVKVKQRFSVFKDVKKIPEASMNHIAQLAPQLRMGVTELTELISSLAVVMVDQDFVNQTLAINETINSMSAEN